MLRVLWLPQVPLELLAAPVPWHQLGQVAGGVELHQYYRWVIKGN